VLYASDTDKNTQFELFLVDKSVPGVAVEASAPFANFTNSFITKRFSPDGNWIVYAADHDIDDVFEMYVVATSNPGVATKLNPPLSGGRDICTFRFTPDSLNVVYCADQDTDGVLELYAVPIAAPGASPKLSPAMVAGGNVRSDFLISEDSSFVLYRGDQDIDEKTELYQVNLAAPGIATRLNADMIAAGDVFGYEFRADNLAVIYLADQTADTEQELFQVELASPAVSTRVHPALAGTDARAFLYSTDGSRITYTAEQDTAGVFELYTTEVSSLGSSTRVSAPLVSGGEVGVIQIP
jgi:hypothetical protein